MDEHVAPTTSWGEPLPDHFGDGEAPGRYPYTRGIDARGYRDELWVMGQYSGYGSPERTNRRLRDLIGRGQTGFSIALDLPTQNGLDSDHPLARGEVGRVGVPIDTLRDMEVVLDGIPLDRVRQIRTTANAIGPIAVALFVAAAERHGYDPHRFRVLLQNDPLKEYVARGTYFMPPAPALEFSVDVIEHCARHLPHWEPIEFCGYHIRDAGATLVQELAFAFANGIAYTESALRRGVAFDDFAPHVFLFLSASLNVLEEAAKFRAARRIWARLARDRFGATDEASCRLKLFVYTQGSMLAAREPLNNVVRVAYEALAAALGGVQTLATSSYDEAIQLPSEEAVRLSLRTQQILAYETGVAAVADPLGGSHYVEHLTDRIENAVTAEIAAIDGLGGALAALENGYIGGRLDESAYADQLAVESARRSVVGVNRFAEDAPPHVDARLEAEPDFERRQIERLRQVRSERDGPAVATALDRLRGAATARVNLVPPIVDAVRTYATIGEICDVLRAVHGSYPPARVAALP